jgi:hypothetical protein
MGLPTLGISILSGCRSCDCDVSYTPEEPDTNPDPGNFKLLRYAAYKNYIVVEILYPDCTNYEGRKICLYKASMDEVYSAESLDPHFCEEEHLSPVARFEPTDFGWNLALKTAEQLSGRLSQ